MTKNPKGYKFYKFLYIFIVSHIYAHYNSFFKLDFNYGQ